MLHTKRNKETLEKQNLQKELQLLESGIDEHLPQRVQDLKKKKKKRKRNPLQEMRNKKKESMVTRTGVRRRKSE